MFNKLSSKLSNLSNLSNLPKLPKKLSPNLPKVPSFNNLISHASVTTPTNEPIQQIEQKKFNEEELQIIFKYINDIFEKRFPKGVIVDKINNYINKLSVDENDFKNIKLELMNVIFSIMIMVNKDIKFFILRETIKFKIIQDIINFTVNPPTGSLCEKIIKKIQDDYLNKRIFTGGSMQSQEQKINDYLYKKICRLLDADISDQQIIDLFIDYIKNIFKDDSLERTKIFNTLLNKIDGLINILFTNKFFENDNIEIYIFYILLQDTDIKALIETTFQQVNNDDERDIIASINKGINDIINKNNKKGGGGKKRKTKRRRTFRNKSNKYVYK